MATAKTVFERAVEAWNARDEAGILALVSPDVELMASGGLDFHGREGMRQWYRLWGEACPDRVVQYTNVLSGPHQVIGEGTFIGTHTGILHMPNGDVPPTGRRLQADFVAAFKVADDKITYMRHYLDVMDLMVQLGLVPAPAEA